MQVSGRIAGMVAAVGLALAIGGCGGGGSGSSSTTIDPPPTKASPSAEFTHPGGGKNQPATFGTEAKEAQQEAASAVLSRNLKARANGDWAGQCSSLTSGLRAQIQKAAHEAGQKSCAEFLQVEAKDAPKAVLADTLSGRIAVLRVKGDQAFALYHGNDGSDYVMPMEKEGGRWKVESLVTQEIR